MAAPAVRRVALHPLAALWVPVPDRPEGVLRLLGAVPQEPPQS
jgi:hypothetical protein